MNTEQDRADFEAAMDGLRFDRSDDGTYTSSVTRVALEAYQAGRAALQSQDRDMVPYRCVAQAAHGLLGSAQYERLMEAIDHARRVEGES